MSQKSSTKAGTRGTDRRKWSDAMRRQEKIRADQQMQEARELEEQAKRLRDEAKDRRRRRQALDRHQDTVDLARGELGLDPHRPLTEVPPLPAGYAEVTRTPIKPPFAFVRISFNEDRSEHLYEVLEPRLTTVETEVFDFLRDTLVRTLEGRDREEDQAEQVLEAAILAAVTDHAVMIDDISMRRIRYHLIRDFLGYGPIDVLMHDPELEDISCDGPEVPLYLFHRSLESVRTNIVFEDDLSLDSFVIRLAQQSGKHISIAEPMLDATLPDGSRLQTTLSREVTTRGSSFTIRRFREDPMTPTDLLAFGTMGPELASYMWFLMEHGQSIIMAGGTASGKTTTLNAICQFIPPEKKIVSIEDTREINLQHENWIAGVTRSGFGGRDGSGARNGSIDMFALLGAALRQRPEYLLVGEVRGEEALTLFQAMATGHAVYSTMHADSAESAVYRLENPPISVPRMMLQTLDGLAIQRQVRIGDKMARRVTDFTELIGFDPETGDMLTNTVFSWDVGRDEFSFTGKSFLLDKIMEMQNMTEQEVMFEWHRRMKVLAWMHDTGIRDFRRFAEVISHYYHRADQIMDRILADEKANGVTYGPMDPPVEVTEAISGVQDPAGEKVRVGSNDDIEIDSVVNTTDDGGSVLTDALAAPSSDPSVDPSSDPPDPESPAQDAIPVKGNDDAPLMDDRDDSDSVDGDEDVASEADDNHDVAAETSAEPASHPVTEPAPDDEEEFSEVVAPDGSRAVVRKTGKRPGAPVRRPPNRRPPGPVRRTGPGTVSGNGKSGGGVIRRPARPGSGRAKPGPRRAANGKKPEPGTKPRRRPNTTKAPTKPKAAPTTTSAKRSKKETNNGTQ